MATITIDGKTYRGQNIAMSNGVLSIDGQVVSEDHEGQNLVVKIDGDINSLMSEGDVTIHGDVKGNVDALNVACEDVGGDIIAEGNVACEDVGGDIQAKGNIVHG